MTSPFHKDCHEEAAQAFQESLVQLEEALHSELNNPSDNNLVNNTEEDLGHDLNDNPPPSLSPEPTSPEHDERDSPQSPQSASESPDASESSLRELEAAIADLEAFLHPDP